MGEWVYLNREFVEPDAARISPRDHGFLFGIGLFETLRAYNGQVFRMERHLLRMVRSAQKLEIPLPESLDGLARAAGELLERNGLKDARLRLTVSPGEGEDRSPTLLLAAGPAGSYPPELFERGMRVVIASRRQTAHDASCSHKVLGYHNRLLALREAQKKHCGEALWFTMEGHLAEGCISNVFLVREGRLLTPPLDTPVLPGTTREAIIALAREAMEVGERALTIDDVLDADEVFLTNVAMTVLPVVRVEREDIADGKPGQVTRELRDKYMSLVRKECGIDSRTPG